MPREFSEKLSNKEYKAVVTHELEHVRHKDNGVRLLLDLIAHLFWWIPTKGLLQRIIEGQEVGCDLKCHPTALASALCKSANSNLHPFAHLTKHPILNRLEILAQPKPTYLLPTCLAFSIALLVVLFARFWLF